VDEKDDLGVVEVIEELRYLVMNRYFTFIYEIKNKKLLHAK